MSENSPRNSGNPQDGLRAAAAPAWVKIVGVFFLAIAVLYFMALVLPVLFTQADLCQVMGSVNGIVKMPVRGKSLDSGFHVRLPPAVFFNAQRACHAHPWPEAKGSEMTFGVSGWLWLLKGHRRLARGESACA